MSNPSVLDAEAKHRDLGGGWVLPEPDARQPIHTRSIVCRSFSRADGHVDIDARFIDTRAFGYTSEWRGPCQPGDALHQMQMRLTVDRDRNILAVASAMVNTPYDTCPGVNPNFQRLVGMSLARGFRKALRERLGGVEGCTHVLALLDAMAAAAVQSFASRFHAPRQPGQPVPVRVFKPQALEGTCHSYRADGPILKRMLSGSTD